MYDINSFIGVTSLELRKLAVWGLKTILEALESKLKVSLKLNGIYEFKVSREHYALMKNNLAIQCNKDKEKIYVYDKGGLWFCIDNSYNLDEAETLGNNAMIDNLGVQRYFNSHKATNFKVTPEFILECFSKMFVINNKLEQQISSHLNLIKEYRKENISWRKKKIKEIRKELKEGHQTILGDFK